MIDRKQLKDEELEKVSGGDNNNISTTQQLIEIFRSNIDKNLGQIIPTKQAQGASLELSTSTDKKS